MGVVGTAKRGKRPHRGWVAGVVVVFLATVISACGSGDNKQASSRRSSRHALTRTDRQCPATVSRERSFVAFCARSRCARSAARCAGVERVLDASRGPTPND